MKPIEVACRQVSKRYPTRKAEVTALDEVTMHVAPSEFVSLVGPSGCGKSTLLRLISGLEPPSDGEVLIDGELAREPHPELGMIFQSDLLMPWRTVLENVLLQADVRKIRSKETVEYARQLLGQVGLDGFADSHPGQLSGGMRQRVGICRALLHRPRLLLMDEPFAALDAITRDQLAVDLSALAAESGATIVFVTHSIPEAVFLSDRIYVMSSRPGRIAEVVTIDSPKPRHLRHRQDQSFQDHVAQVTAIFEGLGVFGRPGFRGEAS